MWYCTRRGTTWPLGLWDSREPDALVRDRAEGRVLDPRKLHALRHTGQHFRARGPLNVPPSPQGPPGRRPGRRVRGGRALAARTAEVVFTAQPDFATARASARDPKGRAAALGRAPEEVLVLPGLFPVIGRSEGEARERFEALRLAFRIAGQVVLLQASAVVERGAARDLFRDARNERTRAFLASLSGAAGAGLHDGG